jgi:hypothetical protein
VHGPPLLGFGINASNGGKSMIFAGGIPLKEDVIYRRQKQNPSNWEAPHTRFYMGCRTPDVRYPPVLTTNSLPAGTMPPAE